MLYCCVATSKRCKSQRLPFTIVPRLLGPRSDHFEPKDFVTPRLGSLRRFSALDPRDDARSFSHVGRASSTPRHNVFKADPFVLQPSASRRTSILNDTTNCKQVHSSSWQLQDKCSEHSTLPQTQARSQADIVSERSSDKLSGSESIPTARGTAEGRPDEEIEPQIAATNPLPQEALVLRPQQRAGKAVESLLSLAQQRIIRRQYDHALKHIVKAAEMGADVSSSDFLSTCNSLLRDVGRASTCKEDQTRINISSTDIMATLRDLNVRHDIVTYNMLIAQASNSNDPATAWEIYNLIRANGIEPNEATYVILMKMCRETNDTKAYRQLRYHLQPDYLDHPMGSSLTCELLYCRHFLENQWNFDQLMRTYERHCDLQPLRILGMIPETYQSRYSGSHPLPRPSPTPEILNVMLIAFLRGNRRLYSVLAIYERFLERLKARDPIVLPLARDEITYNILLKAASAHPAAFGVYQNSYSDVYPPQLKWPNMLEVMTAPPDPEAIDPQTGRPLRQLKPTDRTWNIILTAYAKKGLVSEMESILETMQEQGIKPDVVTWSTLLSGFSRRQNVVHVARLLRRMRESKIAPNDHTAQALSHLMNKSALRSEVLKLDRGENSTSPFREDLGESEDMEDSAVDD